VGVRVRLAEILAETGTSAAAVCRGTGIHPESVQRLKDGTAIGIEFDTLDRLARFFGRSVADLLVTFDGPSAVAIHDLPPSAESRALEALAPPNRAGRKPGQPAE